MMNINLIAAVGKNYEIGYKNELVCPIKEDLIFFKNVTIYHTVLMGKNTYLSIGRPLPNRVNIVLTHSVIEDVITYKSKEDFFKDYENTLDDVFIIGGESIYNEFINDADNIYLTEIDKSFKADTFFPTFDKSKYKKEVLSNLKDNDINYKHVLYRRLK